MDGAVPTDWYGNQEERGSDIKMEKILMGSENPNGWKLEELLAQVKLEVAEKINKIIHDPSPQARLVVKNNLAIIEHMGAAEALQRTSYIVLDAIGHNQGPTGKPRIGSDCAGDFVKELDKHVRLRPQSLT